MAQEDINPTDVYDNRDLQEKYTQLIIDGEPIAVIVPFQKEVESEELIDDSEEKVVNFSEIIESEAGLYDNINLEVEKNSEEDDNEKLVLLKEKVLEQDKTNSNLKEPKRINPIVESELSKIHIWTVGK